MARVVVIAMLAVGCSAGPRYGNFVRGQQQAQAEIAADAAERLSLELGDSGEQIVLGHEHGDAFGRSIADELVAVGFELVEAKDARADHGYRLFYVVDRVKGTALLRVTLAVSGRTLSRAYEERDGVTEPAGPWSSGAVSMEDM